MIFWKLLLITCLIHEDDVGLAVACSTAEVDREIVSESECKKGGRKIAEDARMRGWSGVWSECIPYQKR